MPLAEPRVVADLMALEAVVVRVDAPLVEAARLLDERHVHGLPVVDGGGSLVGVISHTDLLRARATEYLWSNWHSLRVRHLMTSPALTVHRDAPVALAARKMERHHVHRLVVVGDEDETLPIGVLSSSDLVRAMTSIPVRALGAPGEPPGGERPTEAAADSAGG